MSGSPCPDHSGRTHGHIVGPARLSISCSLRRIGRGVRRGPARAKLPDLATRAHPRSLQDPGCRAIQSLGFPRDVPEDRRGEVKTLLARVVQAHLAGARGSPGAWPTLRSRDRPGPWAFHGRKLGKPGSDAVSGTCGPAAPSGAAPPASDSVRRTEDGVPGTVCGSRWPVAKCKVAMGSDQGHHDAAPESDRGTCADCGERPPPTSSDHSLLSVRFGWRLQLHESPDGTKVPVWRCRSCWLKFKEASGRQTSGR
jgi:hypothetical protein